MLATLLVAVVAVIHLYILVLEMFLWNTKTGRKAFNLSADFARETRVLAANQGAVQWLSGRGVTVGIMAGSQRRSGSLLFSALCWLPGFSVR